VENRSHFWRIFIVSAIAVALCGALTFVLAPASVMIATAAQGGKVGALGSLLVTMLLVGACIGLAAAWLEWHWFVDNLVATRTPDYTIRGWLGYSMIGSAAGWLAGTMAGFGFMTILSERGAFAGAPYLLAVHLIPATAGALGLTLLQHHWLRQFALHQPARWVTPAALGMLIGSVAATGPASWVIFLLDSLLQTP
jgi:hypothetical protein